MFYTIPYVDCKTAVFFANALEPSSNARSEANVKTERETGEGDDLHFAPSMRDC